MFRYSSEELLLLRNKKCVCISRKVSRKLAYFRIYVRHVPVKITSSNHGAGFLSPSESGLMAVKCDQIIPLIVLLYELFHALHATLLIHLDLLSSAY